MSRFPPAVWQTAESMHITGFRFARGIVGKPPFPSNNLRELKVSYSYVPSVGDKPFQYCGSMYKLQLVNLGMTSLHPNAFLGLGSLRQLNLSGNNLTVLPEELFQWLGSITELKLSANRLSNSTHVGNLLGSFAQLETLDLAVNQLTEVPDLVSSSLLTFVDLSYNQIVNLPGGDDTGDGIMGPLRGLDRLETLSMKNNKIQWVDGNFFRDLSSLKTLDLSNNRLTSFQGYYYLRSLSTLNLSYNQISELGNYTMIGSNLQSLQQFRLNSNKLVLCDAFFDEIVKMPMLAVLDIKSANMPCLCEIENATAIVGKMALVMDTGSSCLLSQPTSMCIGRTDNSYSCNANITPLELKKRCEKKYGNFDPICGGDGYPLSKWQVDTNSASSDTNFFALYLIIVKLIL